MIYLSSIVNWFLRQRLKSIVEWKDYPLDAQAKVFQQLTGFARETEFGKRYDFSSIRYPEEFKERVPVHEYDEIKPFINRMIAGEQNILWPTTIKWFAKSSGTTSDVSKYIPVSNEAFEDCHFRGGMDILTSYVSSQNDTKIFNGKGLIVGGSHKVSQINQLSSVGDLSAVLMQNLKFFAQWYRTPDLSVALMDDWEQKVDALARKTIGDDVTNISGVPTWTIVLIKKLFEISGKKNLKEIWPGLELYIHGGVSFEPYRQQFNQLIDGPISFYETYNASEGFFAFQGEKNDRDLLLHLNNGIYYEFMPVAEYGKENPKTLMLHEVSENENYGIVISTNSGLWRYLVGDTVRFTSLRPYKIVVSGRLKHFINAFGEEVIVDNSDRAIADACRETNSVVSDYTVAPVYLTFTAQGAHEWFIEFEKQPEDIIRFQHILDNALRKHNSDYDAKRQYDLALKLPIIHSLPSGTFYTWLKTKNKVGGQNKVPRLNNNRLIAEEILKIVSTQ